MARPRICKDCDHSELTGWHISGPGRCRPCSVARAVAQVNAVFPPDPPELAGPELAPAQGRLGEFGAGGTLATEALTAVEQWAAAVI